jgi:hypothetical protein
MNNNTGNGKEETHTVGAISGKGELHNQDEKQFVNELRFLAIRSLCRMYRPEERLFVFRLRKSGNGIVPEGLSRRYSAISLIGLAEEDKAVHDQVLSGQGPADVCDRLRNDIHTIDNLGDVSLILWAARATGYPDCEWAWKRMLDLSPAERTYPVVEVAWALMALCVDREALVGDLRERLARRLVLSFNRSSSMFPHVLGGDGGGMRSHVSCFADMVYPIQALSEYFARFGEKAAIDTATMAAKRICMLQGPAGQWWWHYDVRTGEVVEGYPVYAIHQDAMGPMALFSLREAGGPDFSPEIRKGLSWLARSPELRGGSLVDHEADLVWRKVARREPGKLARYIQAAASGIHPSMRMPGLDIIFPPVEIDYEDRPYHLGWLLYAWKPERAAAWESPGGAQ